MLVENQILDAVIQDHKERKVLGVTAFGDIFFEEDNSYGKRLFSVCRIITRQGVPSNPNIRGKFNFEIFPLGTDKSMVSHLIKPKISTSVKLMRSQAFANLYNEITMRYDLKIELQTRLGKLANDEVYGHCYYDDYNSENAFAKKINKEAYFKEVLMYVQKFPSEFYADIYKLNSSDEYGPLIQKKYFGYGFEIPKQLFDCIHLKSLGVWNQSVKDLDTRLIQLKNLNEFYLSNVGGLLPETGACIHKLEYLVELRLTNTDDFARTILEDIPVGIENLKSLRYFAFSGHRPKDWSRIVQLKNLRTLSLSNCGLTEISAAIGQLENLEELDLSNNAITKLPEALFRLKKLRVLRLSKNPLEGIPEEINELKNLKTLVLTQTGLKTLPEAITTLPRLEKLEIKKNPFVELPKSFLKIPKKIIKVEIRNQALYDPRAKAKLDTYPVGNFRFENDFNLKLMVINQLMYVDEVLVPKFDIWKFAETYKEREIDIEEEGYNRIPEAEAYFKSLEIPMSLLIDIKELKPDGGDKIYGQIIPFWDGEDDQFDVKSIKDVKYLPNLKATNSMNFSKELVKELRAKKIKVANY